MWDGFGADTIDGGGGNDSINVTAGDDRVNAGAGDDEISVGFVEMFGPDSYGNDVVDGGTGNDTLSFEARSAIVVDLAAGTLTGGSGSGGTDSVSFAGIENFTDVAFNTFTWADRISGSAAANMLTAADGNDTLDGRAGNDTLEGGAGADQFLFTAAPGAANADLIIDFAAGTDKVALDVAAYSDAGRSGNFTAGDARFRPSASRPRTTPMTASSTTRPAASSGTTPTATAQAPGSSSPRCKAREARGDGYFDR